MLKAIISHKLFFFAVLLLLLPVILGATVMFGYSYYYYTSPGPLDSDHVFTIQRGQSLHTISERLFYEGVIEHPLLYKRIGTLLDHHALIAGEYAIPAHVSPQALTAIFLKGESIIHRLTIPEGLSSYEVVKRLEGLTRLQGKIDHIPAEGALLPETYFYTYGQTRQQLLSQMQQNMDALVEELWKKKQPSLPLSTPKEALILASLIEKETGKVEERTLISGVFVNRLRKKMRLQTDPTVIYAMTEGKMPLGRPLLRKDLSFDSLYNTYMYAGLPPAPICNPGRASIEAALNPEDTAAFYFVADGKGGHRFARTLREHNRNTQEYKRYMRSLEP